MSVEDDPREAAKGRAARRAQLPLRARSASAKEQVRDVLIEAGSKLFAAQEFADVSLRQIAKQAGYSPGMVYKHFPDRNSLFRAIRDRELQPYALELAETLGAYSDPEQRIVAMVRLASAFAERSAESFGIRFIYSAGAQEGDRAEVEGIDSSAVSQQIYALHRDAAAAFLSQLPTLPIDTHSATLSIIAAIAGMATLPGTIVEGPAHNRAELSVGMVRALLCYWRKLAGDHVTEAEAPQVSTTST